MPARAITAGSFAAGAASRRWAGRGALLTLGLLLVVHVMGGVLTSLSAGPPLAGDRSRLYSVLLLWHQLVAYPAAFIALGYAAAVARMHAHPRVVRTAMLTAAAVAVQLCITWGLIQTSGQARLVLAVLHAWLSYAALAATGVLGVTIMTWARASGRRLAPEVVQRERRLRALSAVLLVALAGQLLLGALFRHAHLSHALLLHVIFAIVVLVSGVATGFGLAGRHHLPRLAGLASRRLGPALIIIVIAQAVMGVAVVIFVDLDPRHPRSDLGITLRTLHQAGGALLVVLAAGAWAMLHRPGSVMPSAA